MLQRSNRELGQTTPNITHNQEAGPVPSRISTMRDGEFVRKERGSGANLVPSPETVPTGV